MHFCYRSVSSWVRDTKHEYYDTVFFFACSLAIIASSGKEHLAFFVCGWGQKSRGETRDVTTGWRTQPETVKQLINRNQESDYRDSDFVWAFSFRGDTLLLLNITAVWLDSLLMSLWKESLRNSVFVKPMSEATNKCGRTWQCLVVYGCS